MKPEERRTVVFSILGKTLLNIVAVAMIFALIILGWRSTGWEDNVLYILCSLLVGFTVLGITLMGKGVLNEGFQESIMSCRK